MPEKWKIGHQIIVAVIETEKQPLSYTNLIRRFVYPYKIRQAGNVRPAAGIVGMALARYIGAMTKIEKNPGEDTLTMVARVMPLVLAESAQLQAECKQAAARIESIRKGF